MSGLFYNVGEVFNFGEFRLKVITDDDGDCGCADCHFSEVRCCASFDRLTSHQYPECFRRLRADGISVKFKEVTDQ